ncbi:MAG TPA: NFACT family protein [Thermomicrobiales bacterium]|nr:NFACT family protein [Thermomicrobiales bacterium]
MFDVLTIAAVADELSATVLDGRIQKIGLIDPLTIGMEVYAGGRRRPLVASADSRRARLLLPSAMPSLDPSLITPVGLLLRKYARGGVIVGIEQPPLERLVRISIAKRLEGHNGARPRSADDVDHPLEDEEEDAGAEMNEEGELGATYVHLVVEIMGRHSNLILVDDHGLIMESVKHVSPQMSRVRPIRPRAPYIPPPPMEKPDPRRLTASSTGELFEGSQPGASVAKALVSKLRGMSPAMAREITFGAVGDTEASVGDLGEEEFAAIARETRGLLEPLITGSWAPSVYRKDGEPIAFAPLRMRHLEAVAEEEPVSSISRAAELAGAIDDEDSPVTHAQRRSRLLASVQKAMDRNEARLASLEAEEAKAVDVELFRTSGELIYAYLWKIEPGQESLDADGIEIALDPALSAKENAQAYFDRYRKAQSGAERLPALEERARQEGEYLSQLATHLEQAATFREIEQLAAEWEAHGGEFVSEAGRKKGKKVTPASRPKPVIEIAGNPIFVGRSGRDNDTVTFDVGGPDDTWLHARGVPGSHVIGRWRQPGAEENEAAIEAAASLAAHYSAARGSASVEVDVTKRRFVRKIKGAGPGMVTYRNERTISVPPAGEEAIKSGLPLR